VETLVVAAIVTAIAVAGFLGLSQFRGSQAVESGLDELRAAVEATKRRSVAQEQGVRWGVRFTNATSGASSYSLFKGSSYSTSGLDRTYSFRTPVRFGNPSTSSTYDAVFAPLTGALSEGKVLTIIGQNEGLVGDLILRAVGSITARIDSGLVGYWHLDEGTSTRAYDASGYENTGTLTGAPSWASGSSCKASGCLAFDTAAWEYVYAADSASLSTSGTELTLLAWVYPTGNGGTDPRSSVIYGGGAYYMSLNDTNRALDCYWYEKNPAGYLTTSANLVPLNQWSFVACVWDTTTNYRYVNGSLASSTVVSGTGHNPTNPLRLGAESSVRQFQGYIDEVRVYDRALSADEILARYNDLK
jgi:type II secretory pathway pseudopilin PulG